MSARARLLLWLLLMAGAGLWLAWAVNTRLTVETDITAMLPQTAPDAVTRQALDKVEAALGRRSIYLIGAADFGAARAAAQAFAGALRASPAYAEVSLEVVSAPAELDRAYGVVQPLLLADSDRAALQRGEAAALAQQAQRALYSPAALTRARPFADDPLNFYGRYLLQLLPAAGTLAPHDGVLALEHEGGVEVMVASTLRQSPFALDTQQRAMAAFDAACVAARAVAPDVRIIGSGVLRHAAANAGRAQREISVIGGISLGGVILVFLLVFRSLRPLLLVLLSLGAASVVSIATVATLYGRLHLVAVVFESSLIGLAVDYSMHFFSDRFRAPGPWRGMDGLSHVGTAITVGMSTTLLAYCSFLVTPFPGIQQMAVLSMSGLLASYLTVTLAYPALAGTPPPASKPLLALRARLEKLGRPPRPIFAVLLAAAALLLAAGLTRLHFADDVRSLQSSPQNLIDEERLIRERLGGGFDTRFFLIEAADLQQLLQREEALRARLDALVGAAQLGGYTAISRLLPSQQRLADNAMLLAGTVYAEGSAMQQMLGELGFAPEVFAREQAAFAAARAAQPDLQALLATPAGASLRPLWLGQTARGVASVVTLAGVTEPQALVQAAQGLDGVRLIDRVADISSVLAHYRRVALLGLAGALAVIGVVLALRYGPRGALRHLLAPGGGALLTLATLGALGIDANLFTVLALLLVLGLGVDYSVFLREGEASRPTTLLAITLAGLITLLAFGLLAASATPFIRSLGLAVLLGVGYTWLLAVLAAAPARAHGRIAARDGAPEH